MFEQFADTKTERQRFIEIICDKNPLTKRDVEPSFGYVVLADLLLRNYINTVVTTNFDDRFISRRRLLREFVRLSMLTGFWLRK